MWLENVGSLIAWFLFILGFVGFAELSNGDIGNPPFSVADYAVVIVAAISGYVTAYPRAGRVSRGTKLSRFLLSTVVAILVALGMGASSHFLDRWLPTESATWIALIIFAGLCSIMAGLAMVDARSRR